MKFLIPFLLSTTLLTTACSQSVYEENGDLILPDPPSATRTAEPTPLDRALRSKMVRYDRPAALDAVGASTFLTAVMCRVSETCGRQRVAEVFVKGSTAAISATAPLPDDAETVRESTNVLKNAQQRVKWAEDILAFSSAYIKMAERDLDVLAKADFETGNWVALHQRRVTALESATRYMRPVAVNLAEVSRKTRFPQHSVALNRLTGRMNGVLRETIKNQNRLRELVSQMGPSAAP